jgi:transcriptional regulator with XRE-family HTH domain
MTNAVILKFSDRAARRRGLTATRETKRLEYYRSFGQRLRETRLALGISEKEAAAACLTTLRTYRRREAGMPHRGWYCGMVSFVQTYDVSYTWLLAGGGPMRMSEYEALAAALKASQRPKLTIVSSNHSA